MTIDKNVFRFLALFLLSAILVFPNGKISAAVSTVFVTNASPTFNIPAGFDSVKIINGGVDDRGQVSVNGTPVFFSCNNGAPGCPESNGYWVAPSTSCTATNIVSSPYDITSLVSAGNNTISAAIDNCGGAASGFSFSIEISTCNASYGNPCASSANSCGQTGSGTIDCAGNCTAVIPPNGNCPSCTIVSDPNLIDIGGSSTLSWTTVNVGSASIDNGVGPAAIPSGNVSVSPISPTTYTMSVAGGGGSGSCNASVSFNSPDCTLSADSPVIAGNETALTWNTTNATSGIINPGSIVANPIVSGTANTAPLASTTTFDLTVNGPGGNSNCSSIATVITPRSGGLVPCGRLADDPSTSWNEKNPCNPCALILMVQLIIEFLLKLSTVFAMLASLIAGSAYVLAGESSSNYIKAKSGIKYAIIGLAIILLAWTIVTTILTLLGYISPLGGKWYIISCPF